MWENVIIPSRPQNITVHQIQLSLKCECFELHSSRFSIKGCLSPFELPVSRMTLGAEWHSDVPWLRLCKIRQSPLEELFTVVQPLVAGVEEQHLICRKSKVDMAGECG